MVLFDETSLVPARAVCDRIGLQLSDAEGTAMARDCTAMVDGFATPGPRHLRARRARARQDTALAAVITGVREKPGSDSELSALEAPPGRFGGVGRHAVTAVRAPDPRGSRRQVRAGRWKLPLPARGPDI
ncbi:hypothetical protein [Streptomyces sp. NPDC049949]|uniref:hypothetical protein n=1 Tax=Streptomyces sp. NPDC049949 TaxID=3154627 RepID=UPI003445E6A0